MAQHRPPEGYINQISLCPSCGWYGKTQLRMFQCTHPMAKLTRSIAFDRTMKYYYQHNLPAVVYIPLVHMCKAVCNGKPPNTTKSIVPIVSQAMKQQMQLPFELLLREYLTKGWYNTLRLNSSNDTNQWTKHLHLGA